MLTAIRSALRYAETSNSLHQPNPKRNHEPVAERKVYSKSAQVPLRVCLEEKVSNELPVIAKMATVTESVQYFGRKKTAVAMTYRKKGRGLVKIDGCPIQLVDPEILRYKSFEPILLLGRTRFMSVDMRIRERGQSITKGLVAYFQGYVDEQPEKEIKDILLCCVLLVAIFFLSNIVLLTNSNGGAKTSTLQT